MARVSERTPQRLQAHYEVERELADRLRRARDFEERRRVCATMYAELFRQVPDHPRLAAQGAKAAIRGRDIGWNLAQLAPYLRPGCIFLEIGAGDCELASTVADQAGYVYAVDISDQTGGTRLPRNVQLEISDGRSIPVPAGVVDLAFSDQLMEHLHPEDALAQLRNIHRALKPGGVYFCITPNSLYGPSDISGYFEDVARGFHLREYTVCQIRTIFAAAGFPEIHVYVGARGLFLRCPAFLAEGLEAVLEWLPPRLRRRIARAPLARALLGVRVAAIKG
jgi:SAM-dependent methyltransferase